MIANSSFSKINPNLQIAWDATSLELLKTCPRKYQLTILHSYVSRDQSVHLTFGILYHEAHQIHQQLLAKEFSKEDALIASVRFLLLKTWDQETSRPWNSGDPNKNRWTLVRTFVWHVLQYWDDPIKTLIIDEHPAVELSFQYQSSYKSSEGEPFTLCGHLDRLGELQSQYFILDHKTTKYEVRSADFFAFYSPDNQMSMYSFAGQIIYNTQIQGVIIDAAQVLVNSSRFHRGFAQRTKSMLDEWYHELGAFWLPLAERYATAQWWPMNDTACGRYGGCPFRGVCGKDPSVRKEWLEAGFKKRLWDPLKVRGDI